MSASLLLTRTSGRPLAEVCQRIATVAQRLQFGVLATHDLRQKIESKGLPFGRECRVIEVCNPRQAQLVLQQSIAVSAALPCRISVYEEAGATVLATLKPTALLTLFGATAADAVAREVEDTLDQIMEEAAG